MSLEVPTTTLPIVVERLTELHGSAPSVEHHDPFELIIAENVAYLADDTRRQEAMAHLRETVGTTPEAILGASPQDLSAAGGFGILPETSSKKLRRAAEIALRDFDGDVASVLDLPADRAKRLLRKFPGIGEPGAEKILLFCRRQPFLAPDSNALRVVVRLGLCDEGPSYGATYASARRLAQEQLAEDCDVLINARYVLRRHGQRICRNKRPACGECPLAPECRFALDAHSSADGAS
jgi:endonuclease-3